MSERLLKAWALLSEQGVIFIQISDVELANLKCLCDDLFGEDNYINVVSINMKNIAGASGGGEDKRLKKNCEYLLMYARNYSLMPLFNGPYVYHEIYDLVQQYKDEGRSWKYNTVLIDPGKKEYVGSTVDGDGNEIKVFVRRNYVTMSIKQLALRDKISEKEVYVKYGSSIFRTTNAQSSIRSRVLDYKFKENIKEDLVSIEYIPKTGKNKGKIYEQFYKGDKCGLFVWLKDTSEVIHGELFKKDLQGTYWDMTGFTKNVAKEGGMNFANGKKPVGLLKQIVSLYSYSDAIILDFFAGSGTTAESVLELNKEDGGHRSFILCTNNENNICREITYPRVKTVITGLREDGSKYSDGIPANLKYYHTDFVSKDEEFLSDALLNHITEMIQLEHGIKLDGKEYLMVLTDEEADELASHWQDYPDLKGIYLSSNVLLTTKQEHLFKNVETYIIPDYYFDFELEEAGESW